VQGQAHYNEALKGSSPDAKNMTHIKLPATSSPLITLLGPTASGKTKLAVALAERFGGEILSADSRQVYRGMDIGTGKDLEEYAQIPHHLIDIIDPGDEYNLFEFVKDFSAQYQVVRQHQHLPFLVGGTGMYLDAILNRYKLSIAKTNTEERTQLEALTTTELYEELMRLVPQQHNSTDTLDRSRLIRAIEVARSQKSKQATLELPPLKMLTLGIAMPREKTRQRITQRLKARLKEGMLEEVQALYDQGLSWEQLDFYGLEYRFIAQHLKGELSFNDMFQKLNSAIHQFAKQQDKWFRKIERKGHPITWLEPDSAMPQKAETHISQFLASFADN